MEKWREERAEAEGQPPKERWEWLGDFVYETDLIIDLTAGAITFIYYCMLLGLHGFSFRVSTFMFRAAGGFPSLRKCG